MQIKFLTIYKSNAIAAQHELLGFWQNAIANNQINFISDAKISFIEYTFDEYIEFDREKLIKEIDYKTMHCVDDRPFWYAFGKLYDVFEDLYADLAKTHKLMELIITVKDY